MPVSRRRILQIATLLGLPALPLKRALASRVKAGFESHDALEALQLALGSAATVASGEIHLDLPEVTNLGAVVPVSVSTSLPAVESITLLAPVNFVPLIATYRFDAMTEPFVSTRIKLAKSTQVMAVVKSGGQLFSEKRTIQVNRAGCRV